ncbi:MAG: GxxExxY protein [Candidatus Marinimicrobia bacterium]|nr:GxxExxY protein [candidate division WOR-3 bacterium]MCK4448224.1 GxxExxY protein [Candidatus Neomarinimicrobiota bacterium]
MKDIKKNIISNKTVKRVQECAKEVYKILGGGFIEGVYGEALAIEFRKRKLSYDKEKNTEVFYKTEKVGVGMQDFIVNNKLVVELKASSKLTAKDKEQARSYLKATKLRHCLLINFPYPTTHEPEFATIKFKG